MNSGKRGLHLSKTLSKSYPSACPANIQFVFVSLFSDKKSCHFNQATPVSRCAIFTVAAPFVQVQDSANPLHIIEKSQSLTNLLNKKVIFRAKFAIFGILCTLINISIKKAYSFHFTLQFTFYNCFFITAKTRLFRSSMQVRLQHQQNRDLKNVSALSRIRTHDFCDASAVLSQLSYQSHMRAVVCARVSPLRPHLH